MTETPRCRDCGGLATVHHDRALGRVWTTCATCGGRQGRGVQLEPPRPRRGGDKRHRADRLARNAAIRSAYDAGETRDALAERYGLRPRTIYQITAPR